MHGRQDSLPLTQPAPALPRKATSEATKDQNSKAVTSVNAEPPSGGVGEDTVNVETPAEDVG